MNQINNLNEFCYANLDLIEEKLEKQKKVVLLIAGASSSGKSYAASNLKQFLEQRGHKCCSFSTDNYNKGISGIISDKVNLNYFNGQIEDIDKIKSIIKDIIKDSDFDKKFCEKNIELIKSKMTGEEVSISKNPIKLNLFLKELVKEFSHINFDEATVYDLPKISEDIGLLFENKIIKKREYSKIVSEQISTKDCFDGKDYDIIIIEGIYALNNLLIEKLKNQNPICDFVDSDNKTLFLRRVLRDKKITSFNNAETIKMYLEIVVPEYQKTVLPSRVNADLVLKNPITFDELRQGEINSNQIKVKIDKKTAEKLLQKAEKVTSRYERDLLISDKNYSSDQNNILRVRTVSFNNSNFKLWSLIHKGPIKLRKDKQLIRPINILIDDGQLENCYKDEKSLLNAFENADLIVTDTSVKKCTRLLIQGEKLSIKQKENDLYLEYDGFKKEKIENILKQIVDEENLAKN